MMKPFPLSRAMRPSLDYINLESELVSVNQTVQVLGGWDPVQHPHRAWEYAMARRALERHFNDRNHLRVADFGCGIGLLSPMMLMLDVVDSVSMYEVWVYGDEEAKAMAQMELARKQAQGVKHYVMIHRPLCELIDADRDYDAVFCISTLEHIGEYERAFRDLCSAVAPKGMLFLTTDYAEHETDDYKLAYLRAGRMFCEATYQRLGRIGLEEGLEFLGDTPDWAWSEECRAVNDYGFASLAMSRRV